MTTWIKTKDRLPGVYKLVKWRDGDGVERHVKETVLQVSYVRPATFDDHEWLDDAESPIHTGDVEREGQELWRMALTYATNLCVELSNDFNNDDEIEQSTAANRCANVVKGHIKHPHPEFIQYLSGAKVRPALPISVVEELMSQCPFEADINRVDYRTWKRCCDKLRELISTQPVGDEIDCSISESSLAKEWDNDEPLEVIKTKGDYKYFVVYNWKSKTQHGVGSIELSLTQPVTCYADIKAMVSFLNGEVKDEHSMKTDCIILNYISLATNGRKEDKK
jgi:hypothetical protein